MLLLVSVDGCCVLCARCCCGCWCLCGDVVCVFVVVVKCRAFEAGCLHVLWLVRVLLGQLSLCSCFCLVSVCRCGVGHVIVGMCL